MNRPFPTFLEIDLNALEANFLHLKEKLAPKTKFLAVIKAFAYGSAAAVVAEKLESLNVDYFAVAYTQEGAALRKAGVKKPIMILHPQVQCLEQIIDHCLEPCIYNFEVLKAFLAEAQLKKQRKYPVHIKFNTGLNRLGFQDDQAQAVAKVFDRQDVLYITSLLSHLAASEDPEEKEFTINQVRKFESINDQFIASLGYQPIRHLCNTSGILNYPEAHFDMVRSGIGLYGFSNDPEKHAGLKPIASLKTHISQIHHVPSGESVGYNRGHVCTEAQSIAVVPIGHADGIGRQYGKGKGQMMVNGQKAPIVGNVCMDMIMLDVTGIACSEGDLVEVFGQHQTAEELAEGAGTISYELITGVSSRVPRVVLP
jgi:alanine racemase